MSYRPDNWVNPHDEYHDICDVPTVQDAEWEAFEAGADAILESIKNKGYVIIDKLCPVCGASTRLECGFCSSNRFAIAIFPDEEEDGK